jgi:hypothetical protein
MTNDKKQTAVEWLFQQTLGITLQLSQWRISHRTWELEMVKISNQAKAMEEEQIKYAYQSDRFPCSEEDAEQYFNETYKQQ